MGREPLRRLADTDWRDRESFCPGFVWTWGSINASQLKPIIMHTLFQAIEAQYYQAMSDIPLQLES